MRSHPRKVSERIERHIVVARITKHKTISIQCRFKRIVPVHILERRHIHIGVIRIYSIGKHPISIRHRLIVKCHRTFNLVPCLTNQLDKTYHAISIAFRIKWEIRQVSDIVTRHKSHTSTILQYLSIGVGCDISSPHRSKCGFLRVPCLQNNSPKGCITCVELVPISALLRACIHMVRSIHEGHRKRGLDYRCINLGVTLNVKSECLAHRTDFLRSTFVALLQYLQSHNLPIRLCQFLVVFQSVCHYLAL